MTNLNGRTVEEWIGCKCYFCSESKLHPERHKDFYPTSGRTTKANSLDPEDIIWVEACSLCAHQRMTKDNKPN